jgi:DNA-binding GntR family transcriptional regulator
LHVRIAEGCGNDRIRRLLCDELYHLLRLYRARSGDQPGRREDAFSEHWQILRAMRARDADLAESLMRTHIGRATSDRSKRFWPSRASKPAFGPQRMTP